MNGLIAAALGVVQGMFMFVPVSSTSHLALMQHLLIGRGVDLPDPESAQMVLFDLILHVGTLVSIAVVMRRPIVALASGARAEVRTWYHSRVTPSGGALHTLRMLALATAVTGVLGLGVRAIAPAVFGAPAMIAAMLLLTGLILWWTDRARPLLLASPVVVAVTIGAAQALALLPGLSRSGLTIAMALAVGLRRAQAAEFSFLVAIPTILAATFVQWLDVRGEPIDIPLSSMAIGFVVSAMIGVLALLVVLHLLYSARFRIFSLYVWALALVVLGVGFNGAEVF